VGRVARFFKVTVGRNTAQMTLSLTQENAGDLHCVGRVATTDRAQYIDPVKTRLLSLHDVLSTDSHLLGVSLNTIHARP